MVVTKSGDGNFCWYYVLQFRDDREPVDVLQNHTQVTVNVSEERQCIDLDLEQTRYAGIDYTIQSADLKIILVNLGFFWQQKKKLPLLIEDI